MFAGVAVAFILLLVGLLNQQVQTATTQNAGAVSTSTLSQTAGNSHSKHNNYYGTLIGKLNRRDHNVSGDVYAVDEQTLFIKNFNYDGLAPDAYFWSSVTSAQPGPTADGFIVPDEKGSTKPLERYTDKDIVLRLPEGKTLREINWLSIWSRHNKQNSGEIFIGKQSIIPRPLEIGPFSQLAHGLKSGPITIVDAQTFLVPDFHYDGLGPEAYFWLTRGSQGLNGNGLRLKDENGLGSPLRKYTGETVVITLPEELTIYDFDYFGVWCQQFSVNFGQTRIPQLARVPPSPKMLGIKPENKLNCEILYDDLGYEIRWVLDGDDIVMQLVGKIEPNEYMAFGLGKDDSKSDMNNADAVVTWVDRQSGQVHAVDYFLASKQQCSANEPFTGSCPDVKLQGGGDSLTLLHGAIVNGYSMVTFKRPQLGIDEQYDQHVYSDGQQSVIWAIGSLNAKKEVGYHRLKTRQNMFIDFARNPQWNCPIPDLNASMHNNLPISSAASQIDPTVISATVGPSNSRTQAPLGSAGSESQPRPLQATNSMEEPLQASTISTNGLSSDEPIPDLSRDMERPSRVTPNMVQGSTTQLAENSGQPISNRTAEHNAPWFIPSIACPSDRTFYAQIGPTAGHKGYEGLTGRTSWGISWYVNGLMIPELVVERGQTYRFIVEGGNDKTSATRRHPFYLTDSQEGGFDFKTDDERLKERIFGGVALRPDGQFVPTAEGRLCEWKQTNNTLMNPDLYQTFSAYQRTLKMECLPGQASMLKFAPDSTTPDYIYYQCYTHRFMGWRIRVVNSCQSYLDLAQQPASRAFNNNKNIKRDARIGSKRSLDAPEKQSSYKRRSLTVSPAGNKLIETLKLSNSEPRISFESPNQQLLQQTHQYQQQQQQQQNQQQPDGANFLTGTEFGDDASSSSSFSTMNDFSTSIPLNEMLILNNSHFANFQRQPMNLSSFEEILKLSPADIEFLDSNQAPSDSFESMLLQPNFAINGPTASLPLQNYTSVNSKGINNNNHNKTTKIPKTLHSYMRRLASIYYPVQQQLASMLASQSSSGSASGANPTVASSSPSTIQLVPNFMHSTVVQIHPTPPPMVMSSTSTQATGSSTGSSSSGVDQQTSTSSFSLSNLVPKSKIDLSKSTISKKLNKLRFKSGRKYEPTQTAASQNQQIKQQPPTPANEFNYDIFNNQLAQLEKQQKQFQALEMANWPQSSPTTNQNLAGTGDSFSYMPLMSLPSMDEQQSQLGATNAQFDTMNQLQSTQMFLNNLINNNNNNQNQQQQQQQQVHSYPMPSSSTIKQQTTGNNYQQPNNFVQQQHQQPQPQQMFRQPPRFSEIPLGPPNQLGQQPYVIDYLSLGFNKTGEMPLSSGQQSRVRANGQPFNVDSWPMNTNQNYPSNQQQQQQQPQYNQQSQAVFVTRLPQQQSSGYPLFSKANPPQHQQQIHHHHHGVTAPQQEHKIWSNSLPPSNQASSSSSVRYPNIQPYHRLTFHAPTSTGVYPSLEQEYNSPNQNNNQMSTMPSVTLSIHDTQQEIGSYPQQSPPQQQPQAELNQPEVDSLSGSGSGSHYNFRQQPSLKATLASDHQPQSSGGADISGMSSVQSNREGAANNIEPADHMIAIERFSKQSSERRPPSIVHPITGEQIHHLAHDLSSHLHLHQQQQQSAANNNFTRNHQIQQLHRPRFSAMLIDNHIVASSTSPGEPIQLTDILETDQTMHHPSQDLQRINVSEPSQQLQSHANKQHHLVLINVDSDKIQRMGSATSNGSTTFVSLHKQQLVDGAGNINNIDATSGQQQSPTTESVSAVLVRPSSSHQQDNASYGTSSTHDQAPASANILSSSTTTMPTTSSAGPLVPSFGPVVTSASPLNRDNNQMHEELVIKSTLLEPTASNLIHNPSLGPTQHQQQSNLYAQNQFFNRPTFDPSPFTPVELVNKIYQLPNQHQQQASNLLNSHFRPPQPALIDSIMAQHLHQNLYPRPEPPVQVASFLAQHLASHNPMFISSEKSVASNQPMALSVSVPPSSGPTMMSKSPLPHNMFSPPNNNYSAPTNDLIILKPALLTKQAPQTYLLKPEYITNQFKLTKQHSDLHKSASNKQGQDFYYSNEIPNEPSRRIAGNQFDRLSSLSSPPSTSIAVDPMLTATNMAFSTYVNQTRASNTTSMDQDNHDNGQKTLSTSDKITEKGSSLSNLTKSNSSFPITGSVKDNVTTINVELSQTTSDVNKLPQHRQSLLPTKPIPLNFEPISSFTPDGVRLNPSSGVSNTDSLHRDNITDNAILSHVMSLISSNAIPTPPFIPVASYSSADYFLPYSDRIHRSIRG